MVPSFKIAEWFYFSGQKAAKAPDKKFFKDISSWTTSPFIKLFLIMPSTKIAQINLLRWTKGRQRSRLEISLKASPPVPLVLIVPLRWTEGLPEFQIRNMFKRHLLLNHWSEFKISSQNFPHNTLYRYCTNGSTPQKKGPAQSSR